MKVLGLIPWGLIDDIVVTTNYEKSAEVIVGGNAEGQNNLTAQVKCMLHNKSDRESRKKRKWNQNLTLKKKVMQAERSKYAHGR